MMACGAMYLNEHQPAFRMHAITLQLSSQVRCSLLSLKYENFMLGRNNYGLW